MYSLEFRQLIKNQYREFKNYTKVARINNIAPNTVRNIVLDIKYSQDKKRGPSKRLDRRNELEIKRKVTSLVKDGKQVTARRVLLECNLPDVSIRTIHRTLLSLKFLHKKVKKKIILTKVQRQLRVEMCKEWISNNHPWNKVIFTDEKKFNFDGADSFSSWTHENKDLVRNKRQQGGGGVQIYGMLVPGPFLFVFILNQRSDSADFISFMKNYVHPIIMATTDGDYLLQQDNATIHVSGKTSTWMQSVGIPTMKWPARSPDLNIIENVWNMIQRKVYADGQYSNKQDLWRSIESAVEEINIYQADTLDRLRESIPRRLLSLIELKGAITKY